MRFFGIILGFCLVLASVANAGKDSGTAQVKVGKPVKEIAFSDDTMTYVEGNILATFYHEFGHALIDLLKLPVFAREEDAADSFALVLTERIHPAARAEQITWASADQYVQLDRGYEPDFADSHSPNMVRFFTLICLYYGGNVDKRDDFAEDNNLPEDRAETCEGERALAEHAWGNVLSGILRTKDGPDWLIIDDVDGSDDEYVNAAQQVLRKAVKDLNKRFDPGFTLRLDMTDCDEDNAFYDSDVPEIIMCNEYVPPLTRK
ncbi:MAG: DUF4344 domain-containing metallopeptidase [Paracoccaceae bacterium]